MKTQEIIDLEARVLLQTYARPPFVLDHGKGVYLYDIEGNRYLDFVGGIAVNAFGYGDPEIVAAISEQAARLIHASNLYYVEPVVELAGMLVDNSFAERVFFCNSGSESVEGVIKFARRWAHRTYSASAPRYEAVAFVGSFHGRTYGALTATAESKFREGYGPLLPGFTHLPFNDLAAAEVGINDRTCLVLVEPVQGESGIHPAEPEFLRGLRRICDERGALLAFDEIQCGLGRTGFLFAHQGYGVEPDLMTLAKPLAGGIPLGAILLRQKVAEVLGVGDHGSTFGGNPVAAAAARVVLKRLLTTDILAQVREKGAYFIDRLRELKRGHPTIIDVRGRGLMVGIELSVESARLIQACLERHALVLSAGKNVVRFLPPLIIEREHIDEIVAILGDALTEIESGG